MLFNHTRFHNETLFDHRKYQLISGHRQLIIGLIKSLGLDVEGLPKTSSSIIMEFYRYDSNNRNEKEDYFIKIYYNDKPVLVGGNIGVCD